MDPQCRVVGQHHCVSCDFIENSGARDVSAARTFSYTVTVCLLRHSNLRPICIFCSVQPIDISFCIDCLSDCQRRHSSFLFLLSAFLRFAAIDNVLSDIVAAQEVHLFPG
jgi:hypothetical protein